MKKSIKLTKRTKTNLKYFYNLKDLKSRTFDLLYCIYNTCKSMFEWKFQRIFGTIIRLGL